eukprot:1551239-Heterocapsa_arctica.AAC.1
MLDLEWSDPLDEGSSHGHLECHEALLVDGTLIPGNPKFEKAITEELVMESARPPPRLTTSARSDE